MELRKGHVVSQGSDEVFEQTPAPSEACGRSAAPVASPGSISLIRSEKGQQARDAYRSSGYGTESGDSANGSQTSAANAQHLLSDEVCAPVQQGNPIPDFNTGAKTCVENDFKPRIGLSYPGTMNATASSAIQNPTNQEAEKPSYMNPDCGNGRTAVSLPIKEADRRITPGQQTYKSNMSTEAAVIGTKQAILVGCDQISTTSSIDVPGISKVPFQSSHLYQRNITSEKMSEHHQIEGNIPRHRMKQQQQVVNSVALADSTRSLHISPQHGLPGNCKLESSQPGMDASANNKAPIRLDVRTKPPFRRQDELYNRRTTSGTLDHSIEDDQHVSGSFHEASKGQISTQPPGHTNSTDTQSTADEHDMSGSFYLPENSSSIDYQFDEGIWKVLEKCARCQEANCDNADCMKMTKEFNVLMDVRNGLTSLSERHQLLLKTMSHHTFYLCSHPKCPLPWCGDKDLMDKCLSLEDGVKAMKQRIENCADYCSLFNSPLQEYMKLNKIFVLDSLPLEGIHWERTCMLKNSRKTILASLLRSDPSSEYKYWVIKKILIRDELHHWDMYSRLRDINHKSIATMLWAARYEHHLFVCHLFENLSLRDCLQEVPTQQLGLTTICHIMQQMISAVSHLNNLRIVYLYWLSKNILVTCQAGESFHVKMSNFSCSVCLDNYDGDLLYMTLPPSIMPPELRTEYTVELVSDVWGLGCLLYEIVTGKQVWHEHRHNLDEHLHGLLGKNPVPELPSTYPEFHSLFDTCWETDWKKRKTVRDLELFLADIYL